MSAPTTALLDPRNDVVFKKLLAGEPDLLEALINAVRHPRPPVTVVEILNPAITPDELDGKFIVLDVLAEDHLGRRHDVEMQTRPFRAWGARSVYYLARTLARQLDAGHDYAQLRAAIGIHLLDFTLYDDDEAATQAAWCFELRDERRPAVRLGPELELHLIELPKARRLRRLGLPAASGVAMGAWVDFFHHWNDEERMADIDDPSVRRAIARLRELSADEETRRMAFVRMRALSDERTLRREEREQGRAEGRAEGHAEAERAVLERLLERRFGPLPEGAATRLRDATAEERARWIDRVLLATRLDDVVDPASDRPPHAP